MQIIISHVNTDFDALASMFAAKKLYPHAQVVISDKQDIPVKQFLNIYRDTLDLVQDNKIDWSEVTELILVDVASYARIGKFMDDIQREKVKITIYDHHPRRVENVLGDNEIIEPVGAAVTLLIEEIRNQNIPISSFEATLFGLGIYTDTGFFTNDNTTARDLLAASFLMEQGMSLEIIQRFSDQMLLPEQQEILNRLFIKSNTYEIDGLQIVISSCQHSKFQSGLSILTQKLMEITGADAALTVVGMKKHVYIVGRASSDRISLLPLLQKYKGGGHEQAGSAMVKNANREEILDKVTNQIELILKPAITAKEMMTSPVKTILPETTIEEAGHQMYRYGHSGYPVVENNQLIGIITRRDLDKGNHHGLGHAPVKAYMSTNVISISPETTLEEIQKIIIEHNIGRLPVVENEELIGIVSRTNIIEMLHHQKTVDETDEKSNLHVKDNIKKAMENQLPKNIYALLKEISNSATEIGVSAYLIGGIVRDIILEQPNDDIDIVVEGDGIQFSKKLQKDYGGEVIVHESFGTATWIHPSGLSIDVTTSRLEYYDKPASLPDVETSTLQEDLYRRDFTMNAMAICLNEPVFGQIVDPFRGQLDLQEKKVKILHNLSFVEDPTRILRAVRFETRFGFLMDEQTEKLVLQSIDKIKNVSVNRIVEEMKKLFNEKNRSRTIQRLYELRFWQQFGIKGGIEKSRDDANRIETWCVNMEQTFSQKLTWFTFFILPFNAEGNLKDAKRFALTKKDAKFLQEIVELKKAAENFQQKNMGELHRLLKNNSNEAILFIALTEAYENHPYMIQYLEKRQNLPTLLTGEDLIAHGLQPGLTFSKILLQLDIAVLNDEVTTKEEAITWLNELVK